MRAVDYIYSAEDKYNRTMRHNKTFISECTSILSHGQDTVFGRKNAGLPSDLIDLHGLCVESAEDVFLCRIRFAKEKGERSVQFITGRGKHSPGRIPRIRPAIEYLCDDLGLTHRRDIYGGIVIVELRPRPWHSSDSEVPVKSVPLQKESVIEPVKILKADDMVRVVVYLFDLMRFTCNGSAQHSCAFLCAYFKLFVKVYRAVH